MNAQIKTVKGMAMGPNGYDGNVVIRFTSDNHGETLSLQGAETLIAVAFEDIEKIVEKVRKKR